MHLSNFPTSVFVTFSKTADDRSSKEYEPFLINIRNHTQLKKFQKKG